VPIHHKRLRGSGEAQYLHRLAKNHTEGRLAVKQPIRKSALNNTVELKSALREEVVEAIRNSHCSSSMMTGISVGNSNFAEAKKVIITCRKGVIECWGETYRY
jgi:hypothetical protein